MNLSYHSVDEEKIEMGEELVPSSGILASLENAALTHRRRSHAASRKARFPAPTMPLHMSNNSVVAVENDEVPQEVTYIPNPRSCHPVPLDLVTLLQHSQARMKVATDRESWTSHTVLVVEIHPRQTSELWSPLSAHEPHHWTADVLSYLASRLERATAGATDVLSLLLSSGQVLVREQPCSWVLYHEVCALRQWSPPLLQAEAAGLLPTMVTAAEWLTASATTASCPVTLVVLSDGAPTETSDDTTAMRQPIQALAQTLGRSFSLVVVSGDVRRWQPVLDAVQRAGARVEWQRSWRRRRVPRQNWREQPRVSRRPERRTQNISWEDFDFYPRDCVTQNTYYEATTTMAAAAKGRKTVVWMQSLPILHADTQFLAIAKLPAEGTERQECWEVAEDRCTTLGAPRVVKECPVGDHANRKEAQHHVRNVCQRQHWAQRLANQFNKELRSHPRIHPHTPQVSFLEVTVYELRQDNGAMRSILVYEPLDRRQWRTWDAVGQDLDHGGEAWQEATVATSTSSSHGTGLDEFTGSMVSLNLDRIEEDDEEEEEDGISEEESCETDSRIMIFTPSQVAQAFSHFSYAASGRRRLICGLQGVFHPEKNLLQFSDPVIHSHYPHCQADRGENHGREDRGRQGIGAFFATHDCRQQCGGLCPLVMHGLATSRPGTRKK